MSAPPDAEGVCERVIAHLDLDCFYAQVERNRLGIPDEVPLAVQQWGSLIAGKGPPPRPAALNVYIHLWAQ